MKQTDTRDEWSAHWVVDTRGREKRKQDQRNSWQDGKRNGPETRNVKIASAETQGKVDNGKDI